MIQGPPPEFGRITIEEDENKTLITYRWFHLTYLSDLSLVFFLSAAYISYFWSRTSWAVVSNDCHNHACPWRLLALLFIGGCVE